MLKKELLPVFAVAAIVVLASGGIYAYLTGAEKARNSISIGQVRTEIDEDFPNRTDDIYKKEVCIKNTGISPCYVRVFLGLSDDLALNATGFGDTNTGPWYSANNNLNAPGIKNGTYEKTFIEHLKDLDTNWVYIPLADENTAVNSDYSTGDIDLLGGWYYYTEILDPNESTNNLLNYVNTSFDSDEDKRDFDIIVYQESVQIRDKNGELFDSIDGDTWLQAWRESIGSIPAPDAGEGGN